MLVSITDFAKERNQDRDTINAYLRRYPELDKQTTKDGKNKMLDTESEVYAVLCKKYPLPQMVQIIEDTESRKQLIIAQERIIELQSKITDMQTEMLDMSRIIAQAEATQLLLNDKQQQLDAAAEREQDLQNQIQQMRSRTLWQRIFNK